MDGKRFARGALLALLAFLAVTAAAGGAALLSGDIAPGLELLEGSPFDSYAIPGLALLVAVGGTAVAATWSVWRRHPLAERLAMAAGATILVFEIVQAQFIPYHPLQPFYGLVGAAIAWLAWRGAAA